MLCNSFSEHRRNLLSGANDILEAYKHSNTSDINMLKLLLYGSKHLPSEANKLILNLTIMYISEAKRLD